MVDARGGEVVVDGAAGPDLGGGAEGAVEGAVEVGGAVEGEAEGDVEVAGAVGVVAGVRPGGRTACDLPTTAGWAAAACAAAGDVELRCSTRPAPTVPPVSTNVSAVAASTHRSSEPLRTRCTRDIAPDGSWP